MTDWTRESESLRRQSEALQRQTEVLQKQSEALQRHMDALREQQARMAARLQVIEDVSQPKPAEGAPVALLEKRLRSELDRHGAERGIGVWRTVILLNSGGSYIRGMEKTWTEGLPIPGDMVEVLRAYADPFVLGTLQALLERYFQDRPLSIAKAELAQTLGVEESILDERLHAFLANETLRLIWKEDALVYELSRPEILPSLLTLVGG